MGFFSKDIKSLNDLFVHTLRDIYYAEQQIAKNLPDMIEKATDQSLRTDKTKWSAVLHASNQLRTG
jgi:ferritin-like metal-binding protein YciE